MTKEANKQRQAEKQEKAERLAQALKDNLKRRKAQARKATNSEIKE